MKRASKAFLRGLYKHRAPNPLQDAARGRDSRAGKTETHNSHHVGLDASKEESSTVGAVAAQPAREAKRKRGRPFITEPRPWEIAGISRRTWYRKEKGK